MTTDDNHFRVNLVLRRDRDGELFHKMASVLAGVPERDRAEVVRRQMTVWLALQQSRTPNPTPPAAPVNVPSSSPVASGGLAGGRVASHAAAASEPLPARLDLSQLDGIDMSLEEYEWK